MKIKIFPLKIANRKKIHPKNRNVSKFERICFTKGSESDLNSKELQRSNWQMDSMNGLTWRKSEGQTFVRQLLFCKNSGECRKKGSFTAKNCRSYKKLPPSTHSLLKYVGALLWKMCFFSTAILTLFFHTTWTCETVNFPLTGVLGELMQDTMRMKNQKKSLIRWVASHTTWHQVRNYSSSVLVKILGKHIPNSELGGWMLFVQSPLRNCHILFYMP